MTRLALAIVVTAATGVGLITTHQKRPTPAQSDVSTSAIPLRATRSQERQPLAPVNADQTGEGATPTPRRRIPVRRVGPSRPAGASALSDVTMYCSTGNRNAAGRWPQLGDVAVVDRSIRFGTRVLIDGDVYIVRDWIGSGSDFDIYGGSDPGCERRALDYGRHRVRVVVAS